MYIVPICTQETSKKLTMIYQQKTSKDEQNDKQKTRYDLPHK